MAFEQSKWIWNDGEVTRNQFIRVPVSFRANGGKVLLRLCAETDYYAELNGEHIGNCQFAGYRDRKYYDEIDLSGKVLAGENRLEIVARYEGVNSSTHIDDGAGLIFEVTENGKVIAASGADTLCAIDPRFVVGTPRLITGQLGYSYDQRTARDEEPAYRPAAVLTRTCEFRPRPVARLYEETPVSGKPVAIEERKIYDFGRETVGYLYLKVRASAPGTVTLVYGEHLADGCVRYLVGGRNFSFLAETAEGENEFTYWFVRAGCRYAEVFCDDTQKIVEVGIIPVMYPLTEKPNPFHGLDQKIYETGVRTLRLCMHTHYEDCPWREQALYVLDSKNQMLCGYDAFRETSFARENIIFMAHGAREDGLLELTYPAVNTPAIPFFSMMYPTVVAEYLNATGDKTLPAEVFERAETILSVFAGLVDEAGLIPNLPHPYWNFYEWSNGSDGSGELSSASKFRYPKYDLILNCAFCYSAKNYEKIAKQYGRTFSVETDGVKNAIEKTFHDPLTGYYTTDTFHPAKFTQLANAFALLIGLGDERTLRAVRRESDNVVEATLSMRGFVYDALLLKDPAGAQEWILSDIRTIWGRILDQGATSFYETVLGEADFSNAGSLCHGWSAIPVHYLTMLAEK